MITIRTISKMCLVIIIMFYVMPTWALNAIGWHWYNEPGPVIIKSQKKEHQKIENSTAESQMLELRKQVREVKAYAILYPTEQNVRDYLLLQEYAIHKASLFSQMWQKTLLDYPDLDYSILHPTENNAQHILYTEENKKKDVAIAKLRRQYGLFFFYRGNNALDKALAPSIVSFAVGNRIVIIPVSVDGKVLSDFKNNQNSKIDHGEAQKLGIKYFPALILVNPKAGKVRPLSYGFISQDELRRRFLEVASNFKEGV